MQGMTMRVSNGFVMLVLWVAGPPACSDPAPPDADADGDADVGTDADADADADWDADADETPQSPCEELGLPARSFEDAADDPALGAVAASFTVPTTEGDFDLRERWTGCDVYLVIQDEPAQASGWPAALWERDGAELLGRSPRNAHYLFVSTGITADARRAALDALAAQLDDAYEAMDEADAAWWRGRVHFVTDATRSLPGWLGEVMRDPRWGVGIDRFQRIRYIGSYADPDRYDAAAGWFAPNLSMAANEAVAYNFESEREARLEAEDARVVTVFDQEEVSDPAWAGARAFADVELPSAAEMERFDAMELDLVLDCVGEGEYGTCPAWDYIVELYLCDEGDPEACDRAIGRWITTYHREGRWVSDVTGLLPLLASGGTRRFAFYTQQRYAVSLSIRLSDQGRGVRPVEAHPLFTGGGFGLDYNDTRGPVTVPIPADAARVELATMLTGHGGADPGNCAEFCDTSHHFFVNGHENVRSFPEAGAGLACMDSVDEGTVPNQYGTWWYGRSGWCPGREVALVTQDVTDQVTAGADATVEYLGYYRGEPYPGAGASIVLSSWLVVSR
jgi:hypothetical protein